MQFAPRPFKEPITPAMRALRSITPLACCAEPLGKRTCRQELPMPPPMALPVAPAITTTPKPPVRPA